MSRKLRASVAPRARVVKLETADRKLLEGVILPYFARRATFQRVLFVGCDAYTAWYEKFFRTREYWTIDIDPEKRVHGAERHVTDDIANLQSHFPDRYFDLIVLNGVIGYALNDPIAVERACRSCGAALRSGGILSVGWNNYPHLVQPDDVPALKQFGKWVFAPFVEEAAHVRLLRETLR